MSRLVASFLAFVLVMNVTDGTTPEALSIALSLFVFLDLLHQIGNRIALLECIAFIAALELLLVPAVTYQVFPASMPIESATYFSYALPAYGAFYAGIRAFAVHPSGQSHRQYLQSAQYWLQDKSVSIVVLLSIGLAGILVKLYIPDAPSFLGTLPSYCLYVSAFYAWYSRNNYRHLIIGGAIGLLVVYTVRGGMFGELFFWLMLMALFGAVSLTRPLTTRLKTGAVLLAFAFLLLIQSVKGEYRYNTWGYRRGERTGNPALLADLITDRLTNPEKVLNADHLFLSFVRFNQGIIIGNAMTTVPLHQDFARGEVLLSFFYPVVPRLLWPNKPQTGGYENIRRFTTLPQSENTSINLSPVGEGYVNFGYGGILFAGLYGLLLSGIFRYVFSVAKQVPSVILWLPMLYIGCLTMETDVLSAWGSLVNQAVFIALLLGGLKRVGIQL